MIYDVTMEKTEVIVSQVEADSEEEAKDMIKQSDICLHRYTIKKTYEVIDCKESI